MENDEASSSQTLVVDVHLNERINPRFRGDLRYVTWFFNGMNAKNLNLRVPKGYNKIHFKLDSTSKAKFVFQMPTLVQFWVDEKSAYEDLSFDFLSDDCVGFHNAHVNHGPDTVGSITLAVKPIVPGNYVEASLRSDDPEVTNTNGDF